MIPPGGARAPFDTARPAGHAYRSREELRVPDTPARPTLQQRVVMWILHASMFYVVALYPMLLMARFQPDDVVHYGFLRWIAVVLVLYWAALQLFFTERPVDTRPGRQTLAVIAGILLAIGAFTPIVSFPFVGEIDFFREGYGDGYILLIMTGLALALAVTGRWKQVLVPGLGSLAVVLWTFLGVQDTISQARSGAPSALAGNPHEGLAASVMQSIQWEWGWLLLFAGSGLLVYSAARQDRTEAASSPFVAEPIGSEPEVAPFETAAPAVEQPASTPTEATPAAGPADESTIEAEEPEAAPAEAKAAAAEPEAATAESTAAEESATVSATEDETPAQQPDTVAAEADTPADEASEAAPAAPEADATPADPPTAEAKADDTAADADSAPESSAPVDTATKESADTPAEADETSTEEAQPAPAAPEAGEGDAADESDSKKAGSAKDE